jgi:RNA polymerase sigma-70 factor (ECF subfamily)
MDLVKEARGGRESAFLQLFDEHHLPLFRFAYRLTGSAEDAEDIVQECFLELLRPACSYDPARTPIRTYLFGVVRNQALKRLRRSAEWGSAGQSASPPACPSETELHSPESQMLATEMADIVARAVMQLPDAQREVLILAHYEQMPLAEIARILEIEVGAVKSRLQRARSQLKERLAVYERQ